LRVLEHEHNAAMQVIDAKVSNKQFPPITSAIFFLVAQDCWDY
jgi:hypothetical protein